MGFEDLGKKLAQLGQDTKAGVQKMSSVYQINSKLSDEKKALSRLFAVIGETVYNAAPDQAPEGLEDEYEAVLAAKERIAQLEEEKKAAAGPRVCPNCGREAASGDKFCAACGTRLPEEETEETEEIDYSEKLTRDAKAAAGEAGDIINSAAEATRGFFESFADKAGSFMKGVSSKLDKNGEKTVDAEFRETPVDEEGDFEEKVQQAVADAYKAAGEAAEKAQEVVKEAAETASQMAEQVFQDLKDSASDMADGAAEKAEEVQEAAEEAVDEAAEAAAEAEEAAEEASAQAVAEAVEHAEEMEEEAAEAAEDIVEAAQDTEVEEEEDDLQ